MAISRFLNCRFCDKKFLKIHNGPNGQKIYGYEALEDHYRTDHSEEPAVKEYLFGHKEE